MKKIVGYDSEHLHGLSGASLSRVRKGLEGGKAMSDPRQYKCVIGAAADRKDEQPRLKSSFAGACAQKYTN